MESSGETTLERGEIYRITRVADHGELALRTLDGKPVGLSSWWEDQRQGVAFNGEYVEPLSK